MPLNERQKRFCDEYLIDLNATQAAIRAGYSPKTAYSLGQRLLKKVDIQEYLQKRLKNREERTEVTQDRVLKELAKVAFHEAADYTDATLKYRYKRILGNSYGLWIATEINEHYDSDDSRESFIKVAMGRQAAAL